MRNPAAEVSPAVDLARLSSEWDLLEGREQRTLAEIRLAKGKLLVEARKSFPTTGRGAGWAEHLRKWKIDDETARRYMKLAGYVEKLPQSEAVSAPPTYAEAGIVKVREPTPVDVRPVVIDETPNVLDMPTDDLSDIADISNGIQRHARSLFNLAQRLAGAQANKTGVLVSPQVLNGLKAEVLSARAQLNDFCRLMGWMK